MLRIIAGHYRSRRLQTPPDASRTRPFAERVKESVFNLLRGHVQDANVLDLFAGVGTMGLEAISRGARSVLMVEQDRRIYSLLQENVAQLGCEDTADLLCGDALASVAILRSPRPLRVVFIDPPFALMQGDGRQRVFQQMQRIAPLLSDDAIMVLRTPVDPVDVDHGVEGLAGPEIRNYGPRHYVLLYGPVDTVDAEDDE